MKKTKYIDSICHNETLHPCYNTDHPCHTERSEVSHKQNKISYKQSGIEWLGEIPTHWEVSKNKDSKIESTNNDFTIKTKNTKSKNTESNNIECRFFANAQNDNGKTNQNYKTNIKENDKNATCNNIDSIYNNVDSTCNNTDSIYNNADSTCNNIDSTCHTEGVSPKYPKKCFTNTQNDKVESKRDFSFATQTQNNTQITLTKNQLSIAKYPAYIYMMSNATNSTLYIGVTSNLAKRIYEHKHKLTQGFSQKYNCTRLVYFEAFENISQAIEREKYLKGKKREFKNKLIESINPQYKDISKYLGLDTISKAIKGDII